MNRILLDEAGVAEGIRNLARSICDNHPGVERLALVGIFNRGVPLSQRLAAEIQALGSHAVDLGSIDITQYRDDLSTMTMAPKLYGSDIPFSIDDARVVLCDEVIFTGRSVRAALDELLDHGRPSSVQLAVLVDRAGREFPIQPDYSALRVSVEPNERVSVRFTEVDDEDVVMVEPSPELPK